MKPERREHDRYRVTIHLNGQPEAYRLFRTNRDATEYQRLMREACRAAGLPVFIKRERITPEQSQ